MMRRIAVLALLLVACRGERRIEPTVGCEPNWLQATTDDGAASFCIPPGFRRVGTTHFWTTDGPGSPPRAVGETWIHVVVVPQREVDVDPHWPPSLKRDSACVDCYVASDLSIYSDTVSGVVVRVEVGLVTGGFVGIRIKPMLLAAWRTTSGAWVLVQAQAHRIGWLNDARKVVRSVRLARVRISA